MPGAANSTMGNIITQAINHDRSQCATNVPDAIKGSPRSLPRLHRSGLTE